MDENAQVHPQAVVQGDVEFGRGVQVWPGAVIKGPVQIGNNVIVLENALVLGGEVGEGSILSPRCVVVDSIIGNECLVGPGSRVIDGVQLGDRCVVEAEVLLRGQVFDAGSIIGGDPPGNRGLVDEHQRELLANKREELCKKFLDYGALRMLDSAEALP